MSNTEREAPRSVFFSAHLLPRSYLAKIFSSAPYSRKPSAYIPPSTWVAKFHTHIENRQNFGHVYINLYIYGCKLYLQLDT